MRQADDKAAFAVCSLALSEDLAQDSFAGEFETVLDGRDDWAFRPWLVAGTPQYSCAAATGCGWMEGRG